MNDQNHSDPQQLAVAVGHALFDRDRASQALGMSLDSIAPGRAQMTMAVRDDMCNGHGTCHGGLIFTLADSTFAFACNSYNINAVAIGCTIDFLAPARSGDTLIARAEARQQGSRTGVYDIAVVNQHEQTIALFRGKSYRVKGDVLAELAAHSPEHDPGALQKMTPEVQIRQSTPRDRQTP